MLRLSVSDLEAIRWWKDSDAPLETLLSRLRHEERPTPQMMAGRAFAKVLEKAAHGEMPDVVGQDDWEFDFSRANFEVPWPIAREIKAEVPYDTPSGRVVLVGQVDALDGRAIRDAKLTEQIDAEKYTDSLQWRAYLAMFEARSFTYDLFRAKYTRNGDNIARRVEVIDYMPITFYAYPAMEDDVQRAVNELASVVTRYLPERVAP